LGANEDTVPQLHGFRMFDNYSGANLKPMSTGATHGAKQNAPKVGLEGTFCISIPGIEIQQVGGRVSLLEMLDIRRLPLRIPFHRTSTEHRRDGPHLGGGLRFNIN
jgi:hypothetical protein